MPHVIYTLKLGEDTFEEKDILEHTDDPKQEVQKIVNKLNENRQKLKEPLIELVSVKVTNPFYHLHSWIRTHEVKWVEKTYYRCKFCNITGHKRIGHPNCSVIRDEVFKKEQHEICRDQLRELPEIKW